MYELTMTSHDTCSKTISDDVSLLLGLADCFLNNETANGHIIDSTTGEVLLAISNGHADYFAGAVEEAIIEDIIAGAFGTLEEMLSE